MTVTIACWIWDEGFRSYLPSHVNTLQCMIARHMSIPHRFVCISDTAAGFSNAVDVIKTPPEAVELGKLRTPEGIRFPSCYRRLWMFSEAAKILGDRVLLIDVELIGS